MEGAFSASVAEAYPTNLSGYFGLGKATLQFSVGGQTHAPFAQGGAVAKSGVGDREVTRVQVAVADRANDVRWHLFFRIDSYRARPGTLRIGYDEDWALTVAVIKGDPLSKDALFIGDFQTTGSLELTQVSTNLGGTISGRFRINTAAFEEEQK